MVFEITNLNKNQKLKHGDFVGHEIRDGKIEYWFGETDRKSK